jgi:diguanylate cyclase (GGDEF)-like protein
MAEDLDVLMDALAGIVRDYGRLSFDLERQDARRTEGHFDQWAQHLLIGATAPGGPGPVSTIGQRQFAQLRQAFVQHRKAEQAEVVQSQDALRAIVWKFVSSLNQVAAEDEKDEAAMSKTMLGLSTALQTAPPADIKRLAFDAVSQIQALLATRRERQQKQVKELGQRLETLGSQLEVARRESSVDGLTQLFNRRAFDEHLSRTVEYSGLRGGEAALLLVDIDHFKNVNDTYGHPAGDAVLQAVAETSVRVFKRKGDFVARYGGEELALVLRDLPHAEALLMARRLRQTIAALVVKHGGASIKVTVSIGAASWLLRESAADWLARADGALYRAKNGGRDRVEG